jgi:large subunit ribosomal protein L31
MKAGIHPEIKDTKVHCNGCGIEFTTRATVDSITVEICSNCHPFYTGKQKLVDTAGRVEKFKARTAQAQKLKAEEAKRTENRVQAEAAKPKDEAEKAEDVEINGISEELQAETVELATDENTES